MGEQPQREQPLREQPHAEQAQGGSPQPEQSPSDLPQHEQPSSGAPQVEQPVRSTWAMGTPLLTDYYDTEWGVPVFDESGVFERLSLEAFQSGLSWLTILRKREAFREAFASFDIDRVAAFDESDIECLLSDERIIRNRAKITATLANARACLELKSAGATLSNLIWAHMPERSPQPRSDAEVPTTSPESIELAKTLKRQGFRFVGPTTAFALMTALGVADVHLVSSHRRGCSGLWNTDGTRTAEGHRVAQNARAASAEILVP